jgi:hypothetical protein
VGVQKGVRGDTCQKSRTGWNPGFPRANVSVFIEAPARCRMMRAEIAGITGPHERRETHALTIPAPTQVAWMSGSFLFLGGCPDLHKPDPPPSAPCMRLLAGGGSSLGSPVATRAGFSGRSAAHTSRPRTGRIGKRAAHLLAAQRNGARCRDRRDEWERRDRHRARRATFAPSAGSRAREGSERDFCVPPVRRVGMPRRTRWILRDGQPLHSRAP